MKRAGSNSSLYLQLFELALEKPEGILVPRSSPQAARNLRTYLYHFRRELRQTSSDHYNPNFHKLKMFVEPSGLRVKMPSAPGESDILRALG